MAYDVEGARKAGLSDAEINNYLASKYKYNLAGAREAGLADTDILAHLLTKQKAAPTPVAAAPIAAAPVADSKGRFDANNQPRTPAVAAEPILSPEEQVTSQVGAPSTAPIVPKVATQPRPPSELNMTREFVEKGLPSGVIGLKSTAAGVNLLKEANFIGSAMKNLDVYKQIDEGKITSLADAEGLGLPKDQVRMYLAAKSPEAREQMKQNQQGIIDKRQGFVREGLSLFKQYQAEAEKVKGVTPDITDVGTVKDFGNWLAFNVGSGAVQLAPIILAALTTGGPGAFALGTTMGVGETVNNRLQFIQNKVKDLPPEQQANEIEKYIRDTSDTTMAIGLASGALDLFGPVGSILRSRAGKEGVKYLTKKEALKAGAKAAPRDIVEEGLTGGAQEAVQIGGKRTLGEQKGDLFSEENIKDVINAAAAEGAGGPAGTTINTGLGVAQAQVAQNQEKEAKIIEAQKKILDRLNAPGAMDVLGKQFNDEVERLKSTINPNTQKKGSPGRFYTEEEAFAIAGDAILQEGGLDGLESIIGGTNQPGVSVPSGPSGTDTGAIDTNQGDLAAAGTTTTDVGGGETTELNTLAADLKAKYPQLTDEQALANAKESLRQKQIAAGMGAPTPTSVLTAEQEQRRIDLRNILEAGTFNETEGRAIVEELIALENLAEGDINTAPPANTTVTEEETPTDTKEDEKPPVKIGKQRGRPKTDKTPEQIAAAAEYRRQRQDIGKNALTEVTKAEKVLNRVVDEQAIIENSGTEKEAQDTLFGLREERIGALSAAYGLSVDPDQKNKTAGKRATALLEKADPQERELGKQRHEAKQKLGTPSRSEIIESTNGQDNAAFEKFDNAKGALNYIARKGNAFEKALSQRLVPFLNGVKFVIVDSEADMPTPKLQKFMKDAAGLFDPGTKTIYVMRKGGINNTVILHEALHAATIARINAFEFLKDAKQPIPAALRVPVQELIDTMEDAKKIYDQLAEADMLPLQMLKLPKEAFTDVKEFVAYGLSLPLMQDFLLLAPGEYGGEAPGFINKLFTKFVQDLRKMFNMDEKHMSALQDLMIVTNKLLSTPVTQEEVLLNERLAELGEPSQAKVTQPKAPKPPKPPKQPKIIENALRKLRLSDTSTQMNASIGQLMMQTRNASDAIRLMKAVYSSISVTKLKLVMRAFTTDDITRIAGDKLSNLKVINDAVEDMAGMRTRMIRELAEKVPAWINFNAKYEKGGKALADVINAATLLQVDPAKHPDAATAIKNDPALKRIENDILNPSTDPKTLPNLKKQRTERTAAIKLLYEGGVLDNPITGEKYTMLGWGALGKFGKGEGHAIYKMARDSYKQTFDLHEKLLKEKIASSNVPGDINDASTPKGKLIAAITKTFQEARLLDIYFPLMRYGNFWFSKGKGKSGEFYMFESATARNAAVEARVAELNKAGGTNRSLAKMIEDGDIDVGDDIRKLREKHVESSDMLKEIFAMLDSNKAAADMDSIKDNIYQMYLMTLPDKDIRRKFVHRQGKTGFSADAIRNFITSQHTAANQLARLSYADKIRNGIAAAYAEIAQNPDKLKLAVMIREISARALDEITPSIPDADNIDWNKVAATGNKFVFYWLLTSPKSALIQMTQLPIVGLPTLGAEFGMTKASATALRYSALWNKFGTTKTDANGNITTEWGQPSIGDSKYVNEHKDPAYRKALKDAWNFANDKDIFMSTYAGDMTAMSEVPTDKYHNVVSKATRGVFSFMGGAFHHAERISREIMYMSSFELAYADYKEKGMDDKAAFDAATKKALKLTYDALFNYTQYNKPRLMKGSPGAKLFTQFLTYPLQMTSYLVRNFYGMLPFLNKEEKKEAATKFFGTLAMTGLFAGVTGLPLYSFIMGVAEGTRDLMRGEDDEDDESNPLYARNLDLWVRNTFFPDYFGPGSNLASILGLTEKQAFLLQRSIEAGPLSAATDLPFNASTSLNGLWFRNDRPSETSREAFQNFVFGLTGPIGSVVGNIFAAKDDFENGQITRGIEKIVPAWLKGSFTAYRLNREGATTTKGERIMDREFYTTGKLAAQALGFGSTEVNAVQQANFMAKQIEKDIEKERSGLLNKFDIAIRNGIETESERLKAVSVLEDIAKFNKKNPMPGVIIEGETIADSIEARMKRRGTSFQGLTVSEDLIPYIYPLVTNTRTP